MVEPVVAAVEQTTVSEHVVEVQLLVVEVSPKFVTAQSIWQFVMVEAVAQLLVVDVVGELVSGEVTESPLSFPTGKQPEPEQTPLAQFGPVHDCFEHFGPVQAPVLALQSV